MREFVFKTTSSSNLLCRWTQVDATRWILIQLLRGKSSGRADGAIFTIRAPQPEVQRFLREEFVQRYGTYTLLEESEETTSVEVTNYLLPAYRGNDPVELTLSLLGPSAFFYPILVNDGYIHIKVVASPPPQSRNFAELLKRVTSATNPQDFQLIHTGPWDPVKNLKPNDERLSDRQSEVLRLAIEFGYYDDPRRCTLAEIANAFGVSKAAIHKRLVAAESKIIKGYPA